MSQHDYDLLVIGGGSGGVRAARVAAGYGARVAIAEESRFGGTCVIRGCVPKKLLVYASRFRDDIEDCAGFGWSIGDARFDWPSLVAAKDREIARLERVYESNLLAKGVTLLRSRAALDGPNEAVLADGRRINAERILIATGAVPDLDHSLPGSNHLITSNEAFDLPALPRRVVIVGGGYIAVEFAGIFAGLGADVTLVHRRGQVLRGFDDDLRQGLMEAMGRRGIRLKMNDVLKRVEVGGDGLQSHLGSGGEPINADIVMCAIGRVPNTSGLGLERAGVTTRERGAIVVDERFSTNVPSIYAVGDVTDRVNLTPAAIREGQAFADAEFGGRAPALRPSLVPTAVFSTPEIGTVGLTEEEARIRHGEIDVYKSVFRPMRNTLAGRDERMLMKLVVDGRSGRVLGCHVLGPDGAEIVQMAAVAMEMGATKAQFDSTLALHPSAAEELVTMREKWQPPGGRGS